jgi:hypothetical protein
VQFGAISRRYNKKWQRNQLLAEYESTVMFRKDSFSFTRTGALTGWGECAMSMSSPDSLATVTPETAEAVGARVALSDIKSPLLRSMLEMWEAKRQARRFPAREDISPRDMAAFLRNVTLYRVTPDGSDFEYRVMGDAAVQAWGHNFSGYDAARLNEIAPGMGDVFQRLCASIARRGEPLALRGMLSKGAHEHLAQESLFVPLGADEQTVSHILSVSWFTVPELPAAGS